MVFLGISCLGTYSHNSYNVILFLFNSFQFPFCKGSLDTGSDFTFMFKVVLYTIFHVDLSRLTKVISYSAVFLFVFVGP